MDWEESDLTITGQIIGTPNYLSPEQAHGKDCTPASDIYGLGAILYHLITGRPPFLAESLPELLLAVRAHDPVAPRLLNQSVPADLETICLKCLQKEPRERYSTATELAEDLQRFLNGESISARPISTASKVVRWSMRHPTQSVLGLLTLFAFSGFLLVLAMANLRISRAEKVAREKLQESLLAQARLSRQNPAMGRRIEALAALKASAGLHQRSAESELAYRNEAIACLALPDVRFQRITNAPFKGRDILHAGETRLLVRQGNQLLICDRESYRTVSTVAAKGLDGELKLSPRGNWLANISKGKVDFWNVALPQAGRVSSQQGEFLEFSADDAWVVIRKSGQGLIVTTPDQKEIARLHETQPRLFHLSPDRRWAAVVEGRSNDELNLLRLYRMPSAVIAWEQKMPHRTFDMEWSPDSSAVLLGGFNGFANLYAVESGRLIRSFPLRGNYVDRLAFEPTGRFLAMFLADRSLRVWDVPAGMEVLRAESTSSTFAGEWAKDRIFVRRKKDELWDLELVGKKEFRAWQDPMQNGDTFAVAFSPDERLLVTGNNFGVSIWDLQTSRQVGWLPERRCFAAAFAPDGKFLLISSTNGLTSWPITVEEEPTASTVWLGPRRELIPPQRMVEAELSADGTAAAVVVRARDEAWVLQLEKSAPPIKLGKQPNMNNLAFSPCKRFVATSPNTGLNGSQMLPNEKNVKVWDVASGNLIRELAGGTRTHLAFSPDSRWLASGSSKGFHVWNTTTWNEEFLLPLQDGTHTEGRVLTFSPDGKLLALLTAPAEVSLLECSTWKKVAVLDAPGDNLIRRLRFSPNGNYLGAGCSASWVEVWNIRELRRSLRDLGLDWGKGTAFPAEKCESKKVIPLKIRVSPANLAPIAGTECFPLEQSLRQGDAVRPIDLHCTKNCESLSLGKLHPGLEVLPELLVGKVNFLGIPYTIRKLLPISPRQPTCIVPVGRVTSRIHMLVGADGEEEEAKPLASCVIEYADGHAEERFVRYGFDVRSTVYDPQRSEPEWNSVVAWKSGSETGAGLRLYHVTWNDLRPNSPIRSLQFKGTDRKRSVFIAGITTED
jgi:WD40 repeat protein